MEQEQSSSIFEMNMDAGAQMRTPGTVSDVSAMDVASTTLRLSEGLSARSCSAT